MRVIKDLDINDILNTGKIRSIILTFHFALFSSRNDNLNHIDSISLHHLYFIVL